MLINGSAFWEGRGRVRQKGAPRRTREVDISMVNFYEQVTILTTTKIGK